MVRLAAAVRRAAVIAALVVGVAHVVLLAAGSLTGVFGVGTNNATATATTPSRTTAASSLITACGGHFKSGGGQGNPTFTDSASNTYTSDASMRALANTQAMVVVGYNIGGTRGATHTVTSTSTSATNSSVSGQEFAGIDASPTVVKATATGNTNAPSVSVTVGSSSTVVACMVYDGGTTTIAANSGTQASEVDEGNINQDQNVIYKVGQPSGSVTMSWSLGAIRQWAAVAVSFTDGGGGTPRPKQLLTLGVG